MSDPQQGGLVPPDGEKPKRKSSARYWIGLLIILAASYTIKNIHDNAARKKVIEMVPKVKQAMQNLAPDELGRFYNLGDETSRIFRKYLTVDEYKDYRMLIRKGGEGTFTQEEFNRLNGYSRKVEAHVSRSEKVSLDEFSQMVQQLAGIKK